MMFGNSRRGGRMPSFLPIGLLVLMAILGFNYWVMSTRNSKLQLEVLEIQVQVKKTETAKSRLEKRNSELMGQVDTQRRQLDEKEDECHNLGNVLQNKENLMKKCFEEKVKFQNNVTDQRSLIHRLQEQLTELRQEFMRQDDQLQEYRKNSTSLEKKLEYESLQCGRQISALKEQCEEKIMTLGKVRDQSVKRQEDPIKQNQPGVEEEVANPQKSDWDYNRAKLNSEMEQQTTENNKPSINLNGNKLQPHLDNEKKILHLGKADDDAGMPGIEENEQAKPMDRFLDHKKNKMIFEGIEKPVSRSGGIPGDKLFVETEVKSVHRFERGPAMQGPQNPADPYDNQKNMVKIGKPFVLSIPNPVDHGEPAVAEDEDLRVRADEIGEPQNHQPAPDKEHQGKLMHHLAKEPAMPPPPNQALHFAPGQALPNLFEKGREKANEPGEHPKGHQGQFFDENESPADPQHDSKVADYNGDDGNVGEYEADKQAELAYNEEEDGDGGEEDVQDEEEQDLPGDMPAVHENRRFAADGL